MRPLYTSPLHPLRLCAPPFFPALYNPSIPLYPCPQNIPTMPPAPSLSLYIPFLYYASIPPLYTPLHPPFIPPLTTPLYTPVYTPVDTLPLHSSLNPPTSLPKILKNDIVGLILASSRTWAQQWLKSTFLSWFWLVPGLGPQKAQN